MSIPNKSLTLLFSYGFRPLFLLVVLQALTHISLWLLIWNGAIQIQLGINPVVWHSHEMLIGFVGAAIGGFLLTAVATWTGRPPVSGWPLLVLCLSWLGARIVMFYPLGAAIASVFYWLWLLLLMSKEVLSSGNRRNYKILLVLFAMLILETLYQISISQENVPVRQLLLAQMWTIVLLINIVAGRIIPAFTRNWLRLHRPGLKDEQLPAAFGRIDVAAVLAFAIFALTSLLSGPREISVAFALIASALQFWRLWRWKGYRTLSDPLVWMLHISYAWIPVGILLFAMSEAGLFPLSAGIHALTIGTITSMIISVASRAALGHTGRSLKAHAFLTASIILVSLAAICRIMAAIIPSPLLMNGAAIFWLFGFVCFSIRYVPILLSPALQRQA